MKLYHITTYFQLQKFLHLLSTYTRILESLLFRAANYSNMSQAPTKASVWGFCIQSSWSASLFEWPELTVIARKSLPLLGGWRGGRQDGQIEGSDKWAQRQYHRAAAGKDFLGIIFLCNYVNERQNTLNSKVPCKGAVYLFITLPRMPWESHRNVTQEDRIMRLLNLTPYKRLPPHNNFDEVLLQEEYPKAPEGNKTLYLLQLPPSSALRR